MQSINSIETIETYAYRMSKDIKCRKKNSIIKQ